MKVTSITKSRGITINLGNCESAREDVSLTVEVMEGEHIEAVMQDMDALLYREIEKRKAQHQKS